MGKKEMLQGKKGIERSFDLSFFYSIPSPPPLSRGLVPVLLVAQGVA
jgi:hypothetical protein